MNKLGTTAGRTLSEVAAFEQQDIVVPMSVIAIPAPVAPPPTITISHGAVRAAGATKHFSTVHASFLPATSTPLFSQSAMRAQI